MRQAVNRKINNMKMEDKMAVIDRILSYPNQEYLNRELSGVYRRLPIGLMADGVKKQGYAENYLNGRVFDTLVHHFAELSIPEVPVVLSPDADFMQIKGVHTPASDGSIKSCSVPVTLRPDMVGKNISVWAEYENGREQLLGRLDKESLNGCPVFDYLLDSYTGCMKTTGRILEEDGRLTLMVDVDTEKVYRMMGPPAVSGSINHNRMPMRASTVFHTHEDKAPEEKAMQIKEPSGKPKKYVQDIINKYYKKDFRSMIDHILAFPDQRYINRDANGDYRKYPVGKAAHAIRENGYRKEDISDFRYKSLVKSFVELTVPEVAVSLDDSADFSLVRKQPVGKGFRINITLQAEGGRVSVLGEGKSGLQPLGILDDIFVSRFKVAELLKNFDGSLKTVGTLMEDGSCYVDVSLEKLLGTEFRDIDTAPARLKETHAPRKSSPKISMSDLDAALKSLQAQLDAGLEC